MHGCVELTESVCYIEQKDPLEQREAFWRQETKDFLLVLTDYFIRVQTKNLF